MSATSWLRFCVVLTSMAIVPVLPPADGFSAERSPGFTIATPVSKAFQGEFETAWRSLPTPLQRKLSTSGWRIELAEFVVDAAPELVDEAPRGWPSGMSWRQTDAVHLPRSRKVVLAEKRLDRNGKVVTCTRIGGVLRHELGHAFDFAEGGGRGFLSASSSFRAAYEQDLRQIVLLQRTQLDYYLQASQAGRQETFAECFATVLGGGSDQAHLQDFATSFPHSLAWMRKRLQLSDPPVAAATATAAAVASRTADSRR